MMNDSVFCVVAVVKIADVEGWVGQYVQTMKIVDCFSDKMWK